MIGKRSHYDIRYPLVVLTLLACTLVCSSPTPESDGRYHDVVVPFVEDETFSGVILVKRNENVLFQARYGEANKELAVPFEWETRFRFHSLTKPLLSTAVLSAVADGKLTLDGAICDALDPCPSSWMPVTVHQLLNHTSGIPDFSGLLLDGWAGSLEATFEAIQQQLTTLEPAFEPGTSWQYSNSGYVLLARILERLDERHIDDAKCALEEGQGGDDGVIGLSKLPGLKGVHQCHRQQQPNQREIEETQ